MLIDAGHPVPTTTSIAPSGTDVVNALQQNLERTEKGPKFVLTKPIRIPAWTDYSPEFVPPTEPNPKSSEEGEPLPPVWSQPDPTEPPNWKELAYLLPKNYQWKAYTVNKNDRQSAKQIYALVPDGYDLERNKNGTLKRNGKGGYVPVKQREAAATHLATGSRTKGSATIAAIDGFTPADVGSGISGIGIPPGSTILVVDAKARTVLISDEVDHDSDTTMRVGDVDQFSYGDEVVDDVWPVPQDYFYLELRQGEVDDAAARDACHPQTHKYDYTNNVVCGYFKIGNLLQIMQRLADTACNTKDPNEIKQYCDQSIFGIGPQAPSWIDGSASYTYSDGKESVWVPAHDPDTQPELAQRDRVEFFTLYKLYQTSLVDTSKLVTGAYPITIGK